MDTQEGVPESALNLYRKALSLRPTLQGAETLEWVDSDKEVLHLKRPRGWHVIANFGKEAVKVPEGEVLLSSEPIKGGMMEGESTAWLRVDK